MSENVNYFASIFPNKELLLPLEFVTLVKQLEQILQMPVILLVQNETPPFHDMNNLLCNEIYKLRSKIERHKKIAILLDSPGGNAASAYKIAKFLRRYCGGFTVLVPQYAKSAATLLSLGAEKIIMGEFAELGPMDAQIVDRERESISSSLDEIQSLERLFAASLDAIDQSMLLLAQRTGKKVDTILPHVLHFVSDITKPLFDKIDTVRYTQMSRILKVAEEYATRLLLPYYSQQEAEQIVRNLAEKYPEHGFVIDIEEARNIGLHVEMASTELQCIFENLMPFLNRTTLIGLIEEEKQNEQHNQHGGEEKTEGCI